MLAGSIVLILLTPLGLDIVIEAVKKALFNSETLVLMGSVLLIGMLGHILKNSGAMTALVDSLMELVGDCRWIIALVTGLIGALTVPGGAMLTAPVVDQLGERVGIGPEYKTGVNINFRHIWYIVLPIIPAMLTAANLSGLSPKELAAQNLPALSIGFVAAWFLLLHPLPREGRGKWDSAGFIKLIESILPLLLVIALYVVLGLPFVMALVLGVFVGLFNLPEEREGSILSRMWATGISRVKNLLLPGVRPQLALAVAGVMVFKELLTAGGIINTFASSLLDSGFPLWLLLTLLPFFIGLATGFHEAAIGIAIPIFVPLLSGTNFVAGIGLTYVAATVGYILSPLHLCVILTREYYGAKFLQTYGYLLPVPLIILATALITAVIMGL